jgi:protein-S-isoprenylcysteine O-methyltransferase Ste14
MGRIIAFAYGVVCYAIFFLTFLYLIGFVGNVGVPKGVDDGVATALPVALAINFALIALFGLQHSIMARSGFKQRLTRVLPESMERSTFVLATSLVLILLYWQWRPLPQAIWTVTDPVGAGVLWALFALGFGLVLASTFVIDHFDLFGLRQVWLNLLGRAYRHPPFKVTWFYRVVRHPIYLGLLLAFWSAPTMTLGRLAFALGMSVYIMIGIGYEERDLVRFLGEDYRRYRERVPALLPRPGKSHEVVRPERSGAMAGR